MSPNSGARQTYRSYSYDPATGNTAVAPASPRRAESNFFRADRKFHGIH
jgi:hypothetical protein